MRLENRHLVLRNGILVLSLITILSCESIYARQNSNIKDNIYEGFAHYVMWKYDNHWRYVILFSKGKIMDAPLKQKNEAILITNAEYKVIFIPTPIPRALKHFYGNLSSSDWLRSLPDFTKNEDIIIRDGLHEYFVNTVRVKFSAFNYSAFKVKNGKWDAHNIIFGNAGSKEITPEMVKTKNDYLIVTRFWPTN